MSSLEAWKFIQKVKYGCELAGIPVGGTRLPLLPLSANEKMDFAKAFSSVEDTRRRVNRHRRTFCLGYTHLIFSC